VAINAAFDARDTKDVQHPQTADQSQTSVINGAHILAFHDAAAILGSNNSPSAKSTGMLKGFEIVGGDVWQGMGSEFANHTVKIGSEIAKGAVLGAAGDALITAGTGAAVALGFVAAPEVAVAGGIGAGIAAVGYGAYEGYSFGERLYHDARAAISGDAKIAAAGQKDAQNAGGGIVEAATGLTGFEVGLGTLVAADAKFGLTALAGKPLREAANESGWQSEATSRPSLHNPNGLSREQTKEMLSSDDPRVRAKAVRSGELTQAEIRKAAGDNETVRMALASRGDLPGDLYSTLSHDRDPRVVATIARNLGTPQSVVDSMVQSLEEGAHTHEIRFPGSLDPMFKARLQLASRPDLSASAFEQLLSDPDTLVVGSLAQNPSLTDQQLDRLIRYPNPQVAENAIFHFLERTPPITRETSGS